MRIDHEFSTRKELDEGWYDPSHSAVQGIWKDKIRVVLIIIWTTQNEDVMVVCIKVGTRNLKCAGLIVAEGERGVIRSNDGFEQQRRKR